LLPLAFPDVKLLACSRPDFARQHPANAVYRTLNRDCDPSHWTAETGQLLVNKLGQGGQNLVALWVAEGMQREQEDWFRMSNGDKDTFRYAVSAPLGEVQETRRAGGTPRVNAVGCVRRSSGSLGSSIPPRRITCRPREG